MTAPTIDTCPYGHLDTCAKCGTPMHRWRGRDTCSDGHVTHSGRGLCEHCYEPAFRTGGHVEWPRTTHSRDELMHEWAALSEVGVSFYDFPARAGMTFDGWYQAFYRARRVGHPLAVRTDR